MSQPFDERDPSPDLFAATRMPLGEHIEVLRLHLAKALLGLALALGVSFAVGGPVLEFIAAPVSAELMKFYKRRLAQAREKFLAGDPELAEANQPREVQVRIRPQAWGQVFALRDGAD